VLLTRLTVSVMPSACCSSIVRSDLVRGPDSASDGRTRSSVIRAAITISTVLLSEHVMCVQVSVAIAVYPCDRAKHAYAGVEP